MTIKKAIAQARKILPDDRYAFFASVEFKDFGHRVETACNICATRGSDDTYYCDGKTLVGCLETLKANVEHTDKVSKIKRANMAMTEEDQDDRC